MSRCIDILKKVEEAKITKSQLDNIANSMDKKSKGININDLSDDELKKKYPLIYAKRIADKNKKPSKNKTDKKELDIVDKLLAATIGKSSAKRKETDKGIYHIVSDSGKFELDIVVDTNKKLVKINKMQTDDKLALMQSAKLNKFKVK